MGDRPHLSIRIGERQVYLSWLVDIGKRNYGTRDDNFVGVAVHVPGEYQKNIIESIRLNQLRKLTFFFSENKMWIKKIENKKTKGEEMSA